MSHSNWMDRARIHSMVCSEWIEAEIKVKKNTIRFHSSGRELIGEPPVFPVNINATLDGVCIEAVGNDDRALEIVLSPKILAELIGAYASALKDYGTNEAKTRLTEAADALLKLPKPAASQQPA